MSRFFRGSSLPPLLPRDRIRRQYDPHGQQAAQQGLGAGGEGAQVGGGVAALGLVQLVHVGDVAVEGVDVGVVHGLFAAGR